MEAAAAPSWRAVVAVAAPGSASEPPASRLSNDPAPSGGWGARASRARSGLRRQASHAGAPAASTPPDARRHRSSHERGGRSMLDLLIKNARIVDGTGSPSFMGDLGVQDGVIRSVSRSNGLTARARARRRRPGAGAGLRRSAHALRRADRVGPDGDVLAVARRDHGHHGQLRRGRGAGEAVDARDPDAGPRQRRGHSLRRHEGRHRLAVGELRRVSRRHRPARPRHQRGRPRRLHAAAPLRDGRGLLRARGHRRRDLHHAAAAPRGHGGRAPSASPPPPRATTSATRGARWPAATPAARS